MVQYYDIPEPKNMEIKTHGIVGKPVEGHWNGLGTFERLRMILSHPDHFLSLGLITRDEFQKVLEASDTELEYIVEREDKPLFQSIHLKQNIATQNHRHQLKAALKAVFL